ncbi:MAG: fibronectin type III domain-containing protein [Bacillota bacterium]|nr:fibronectin type III domain-containing protein [Bacillota bacterium]
MILCAGFTFPASFTYAELEIGDEVYTASFEGGSCEYKCKSSGAAVLTSVTPDPGVTDLVLPESLDGHLLRSIDTGCFNGCGALRSLTVSKFITSIADGALDGLSGLEKVAVDPDNDIYFTIDDVLYHNTYDEEAELGTLYVYGIFLDYYPPEKKDAYYFLPHGFIDTSTSNLRSEYINTLELGTPLVEEIAIRLERAELPNVTTLITSNMISTYRDFFPGLETLVLGKDNQTLPGLSGFIYESLPLADLTVVASEGSLAEGWAADCGCQFEACSSSQVSSDTASFVRKKITDGDFAFDVHSDTTVEYSSTNPHVAEVDNSGTVSMTGGNSSSIYAFHRFDGNALPAFKSFRLNVLKEDYPITTAGMIPAISVGSDPFYVDVQKTFPDLDLIYFVGERSRGMVDVDQNGKVTLLTDKPGHYDVYIHTRETRKSNAYTLFWPVIVEKPDENLPVPKTMDAIYGKALDISVDSERPVIYTSYNKNIATVTSGGIVNFRRPGTVTFEIRAEDDGKYRPTYLETTVTCKIGTPQVNAVTGKNSVKLSWDKVPAAQKYQIYCKAPGKSKYKLMKTKLASVRSITHKNLKRGKSYSYKIRAFAKINGKKYYGPYSEPVTVVPGSSSGQTGEQASGSDGSLPVEDIIMHRDSLPFSMPMDTPFILTDSIDQPTAFDSSNPTIAEIDSDGLVTMHKAGKVKLYLYYNDPALPERKALTLRVKKVENEKPDPEITYTVPKDLNMLSEGFDLNAQVLNCDAQLTYKSVAPEYLSVDQNGHVTILVHNVQFGAPILITASETETTKAKTISALVEVNYVPQTIECQDAFSTTLGKTLTLKPKAKGKLWYSSSDPGTATVSPKGVVKFHHPGEVTVTILADNTDIYWEAYKDVTISCTMTAPSLKVTLPKKKQAKLTWTKVGGASQYLVYVKYPGEEDFRAVISKSAKVKSVTHKGLTSGQQYSYKVQAYVIADGGVYYGPFSEEKTVTIK